LHILAAGRSLDSYIAGGIAMNREGPRFSGDIDIFQDSEERLEAAAEADAKALIEAGLAFSWKRVQIGKRDAEIEGLGDKTRLEWVHDTAYRFFPAQRDELFGYVLHPVDLATNKASAAAERRVPRDIVDLVIIHETMLPLGAVVCAALGRFPGQSPEGMLDDIRRHSRFSTDEFEAVSMNRPIDITDLLRRIHTMIESAEQFINCIPSEAVGIVFLKNGKAVQPNLDALETYQRHTGSVGGVWPSSQDISHAMLERYTEGHQSKPDGDA
jgi:hypothetical protein